MSVLHTSDVQRLLECVQTLYACREIDQFPHAVLSVLPRLVRSSISSYTEVDLRNGRAMAFMDPDGWDLEKIAPVLVELQDQHPLIPRYKKTGDGTALKFSDMLSQEAYHASPIYNELYAQMDVEEQMAMTLPTRVPKIVGLVVNREARDFSENDRLLMNLLRPHVIQAFELAELHSAIQARAKKLETTVESLDIGVVRLSQAGKPAFVSSLAQQWLTRYFTAPASQGDLPDLVERWLKDQRPSASNNRLPGVRHPLVVETDHSRLEIRHVAGKDGEDLLVLELRVQSPSPAPLEQLGLTRREAEVLYWIAQGKSNPEISIIIAAKLRTVQKHVERILLKLGVENRTAAAMRAVAVLRMQT